MKLTIDPKSPDEPASIVACAASAQSALGIALAKVTAAATDTTLSMPPRLC